LYPILVPSRLTIFPSLHAAASGCFRCIWSFLSPFSHMHVFDRWVKTIIHKQLKSNQVEKQFFKKPYENLNLLKPALRVQKFVYLLISRYICRAISTREQI